MRNDDIPLWRYFKLFAFFVSFLVILLLIYPALSSNPDLERTFVESLASAEMSEFLLKIFLTCDFFGLIFFFPFAFAVLGFWVVYLIYRLSLSCIYSKPRRVYPVEKQKFFSVY